MGRYEPFGKMYINQYSSLWNNGYGYGYNIDAGGNSGTINNKPVVAYTIKGEYIAEFKSRLEASNYFGISDSTIIDICKGKKSSYKSKYVFRDVGDPFNKYDVTNHIMYREIYQFDLNGNFIAYYNSCQEVPYDFRWRIYETIDNPNKTTGGFWWSSTKKYNYQGNIYHKKVDVYNLDGILLNTYNSISECGKIMNISASNIGSVLRGKSKTSFGYVFRYHGDSFNKYDIKHKQSSLIKKINKYSIDGIFLETYNTLREAAHSVNAKTLSQINGCCLKRNTCKTAHGYKWFFSSDESQPDKTRILK